MPKFNWEEGRFAALSHTP